MLNYNSAAELRAFLEKENLGMQKKFGQNFLINHQTRDALVAALGAKSGDEVWEIGPGLGAMTAMLLEKGLCVKAFEIDKGFIRVLKNIFLDNEKFSLVEGDVLKTWQTQKKVKDVSQQDSSFLLGNLPYNIAAVLLGDLIEKGQVFQRMVVTVQKEVAQRMSAAAGTKDYSSFSVLCASVYNVKPLMLIRPSSFFPQPNVDSMGVLFEKKEQINCEYPQFFYQFIRSLFASRRKTLKNNLLAFFSSRLGNLDINIQDVCSFVLSENSLKGNERAENLSIDVFASLAKTIENMRLFKSDVNCR
ncbi:MAG: 16S rRNA (adenine(1518)-N(6)/adenine(1519)-N(6))-dimethyltransferase RsmA [Treponema sp.]|nr:16S rRNA (adenine(1518)-N(6)/adenine(1519)-N(6))-dimethyltransferase RsmA [Treponema sp.]